MGSIQGEGPVNADRMADMVAAIKLGEDLESAKSRGLVISVDDERVYRALEVDCRAILASGKEIDIPNDWFG